MKAAHAAVGHGSEAGNPDALGRTWGTRPVLNYICSGTAVLAQTAAEAHRLQLY